MTSKSDAVARVLFEQAVSVRVGMALSSRSMSNAKKTRRAAFALAQSLSALPEFFASPFSFDK
jgi:hypothetical protein